MDYVRKYKELLKEKSIFSLLDQSILDNFDLDNNLYACDENFLLIKKGEICSHLIIPLDDQIKIIQEIAESSESTFGTVLPGRSANLYDVLRGLPSQVSLKTQSATTVLKIEVNEFLNWIEQSLALKKYLFFMSENQFILQIVKQMESIGIQKNLIVEFVAQIEPLSVTPRTILAMRGLPAQSVFFLADGKAISDGGGDEYSSWIVPEKSWIGWNEILQDLEMPITVTSINKCQLLQIKKSSFLALKDSYALEFNKLLEMFDKNINKEEQNKIVTSEKSISELFEQFSYRKSKSLRYPWVKQNDDMDCGPACLSMIAKYFGKNTTIQFWRSRLSTDRTGTSLFDLSSTADKCGFVSHCLYIDDVQNLDQSLLPFIALRKYHYLVVYKITKKHIIVGNPSTGIQKMLITEFNDGFDQLGLFVKPSKNFDAMPESENSYSHYLNFFEGLWKETALAFFCSLLFVAFSLVPPLLSQFAIDSILVQGRFDILWIVGTVMIVNSVLISFVAWAEKYYFVYIMSKFNFRAISLFIHKLFSLPYDFFSQRHVGDFTTRISEVTQLRSFITSTLFGVILNSISILIYGSVLVFLNPIGAAIVLLFLPVALLVPYLTSRYLTNLYGDIFRRSAEQNSFITDVIRGISVIKASGSEYSARFRFDKKLMRLVGAHNKFSMASITIDSVTTGYQRVLQAIVLIVSIYLGTKGTMTAGQVISFYLISNFIFQPIVAITKEWESFIKLGGIVSRLNDVFLAKSDRVALQEHVKDTAPSRIKGNIEFKDVWFRYGGESTDWILKGISFKIEAGQKVAIVGPSGSGKSTMAHLLTRMYEPTKGQILIDGKDYREFELSFLRQQIGLLHQETFLFEGTISENIALSSVEMDDVKIRMAADRSSATALIEKRPNGFKQYVPYGGVGFSGGEKQKLSMARLLYQNPSVIILDEATSSLDGIAESEILTHLNTELRNETIINIAHRFSTVQASTLALVMNDGHLVGFGNLDYLAKTHPLFQKLFNLKVVVKKWEESA